MAAERDTNSVLDLAKVADVLLFVTTPPEHGTTGEESFLFLPLVGFVLARVWRMLMWDQANLVPTT